MGGFAGVLRGRASLWSDRSVWPNYSKRVMRGAGVRSLFRMLRTDGVASAPALLLYDIRYLDGGLGAALDEVRIPDDAGKALRVEVELFGTDLEPIARIVRVRVRADLGRGGADPIVAEAQRLIPARLLDARRESLEKGS